MPLSPRHWRARHLLGAWILYWIVLLAATLTPLGLALWRLRGAPENSSNASFNFGDGGVSGKVTSHGATLWSGHASSAAILFWLVGPPLLLWILWAVLRPRAGAPASLPLPRPGVPLEDAPLRDRQATREPR